jgi:hypothetical protein
MCIKRFQVGDRVYDQINLLTCIKAEIQTALSRGLSLHTSLLGEIKLTEKPGARADRWV